MVSTEKQKLPFGILYNGKLKSFDSDPKKAARQFLECGIETKILTKNLIDLFPYKNFQMWMSEFGIALTKLKLKDVEGEEKKLIKLSRSLEDLNHFINVLKNRQASLENFNNFKIVLENTEKLRDKVEEKIRETIHKIAPNLSSLLGPSLASILISKANGLKNLAEMPSSKIQILGAEKSLFKYLEGKDKKKGMPKYGIIYLSPFIREAKKENRGKIARLLSAKIMLAARLDYFSGENRGEKIKEDLVKEIKKIEK